MKQYSTPSFVADAQRRYTECLTNMQRLSESAQSILSMSPEERTAWIESLGDKRDFVIAALSLLSEIPPPKYEDFLCDELNRRMTVAATSAES